MEIRTDFYIQSAGVTRQVEREAFVKYCKDLKRFLARAYTPRYRALDGTWFDKPYYVAADVRQTVNTYIKVLGLHRVSRNDLLMLIEALSRK